MATPSTPRIHGIRANLVFVLISLYRIESRRTSIVFYAAAAPDQSARSRKRRTMLPQLERASWGRLRGARSIIVVFGVHTQGARHG
jgi:hypothetical protein